MGNSQKTTDEIRRLVISGQLQGAGIKGGSELKLWSASRGAIKEYANSLASIGVLFDPGKIDVPGIDTKKALFVNGVANGCGVVAYGLQSYELIKSLRRDPESAYAWTKLAYSTAGIGKEALETLSVAAARQVPVFNRIPDSLVRTILAKADRTGGVTWSSFLKQPGAVKFSVFFKMGGGALDSVAALRAFREGDYVSGGLYAVGSTGGYLAAASQMATKEAVFLRIPLATWGATTGGLVALGAAAKEFLEAGGYTKAAAEQLADYNSDGAGPGPVIAAMLQRYNISPEDFKTFANSLTDQQSLDNLRAGRAASTRTITVLIQLRISGIAGLAHIRGGFLARIFGMPEGITGTMIHIPSMA